MKRTLLLVVSGVAICGISVALAWPEGGRLGKGFDGCCGVFHGYGGKAWHLPQDHRCGSTRSLRHEVD